MPKGKPTQPLPDGSGSHRQPETRGDPEEADLGKRLLEAERQSAELIAEREKANEEAKRVHYQLQQALDESRFYKKEAEALRAQYEGLETQSELDKLRALDLLRQEYEKRLADERARADAEIKRSDSWISCVEERFQFEKRGLEERIYTLEDELCARGRHEQLAQPQGECGSGSGMECEVSDDDEGGRVCVGDRVEPGNVCGKGKAAGEGECVTPSAGGQAAGGEAEGGGQQTLIVPPVSESSSKSTSGNHTVLDSMAKVLQGGEHPVLVESMAKLLAAQTEMLAAQAQVTAVQGFPPLPKFSGEDLQSEDDGFEHWIELFEERAGLAGWSKDQRLYQLKVHLERTALQVFRIMPEQERKEYDTAVKRLKERFRPVDIAELKGMEFHQRMQLPEESIEQLGIALQKLARKGFPQSKGREFDRLLKGRFFQALHTKWQRKLGAPKAEESFSELYDRARTRERHEQQYIATAASRAELKPTSSNDHFARQKRRDHQPGGVEPGSDGESKAPRGEMLQRSQNQGPGSMPGSRLQCFKCGGTGHFARSCTHVPPQSEAPGRYTSRRYAASKTETSGRGPPARTAALTANPSSTKFSVAELEEMLAKRRLEQESELLQQTSTASGSQVDMVTAENLPTSAVGPTLLLELQIEGVKVNALVDSGSQSTIISRQVLQDIGKHFHSQGRPPPQLEKPSARLYGKDGRRGNRPLNITAQVTLNLSADGTSVSVPVFVQPDSEQPCLLGTNAALSLGLKFLRADGRPLLVQSARLSTPPDTAVVRLVQSSTLPGRKGRFLEALIDGPIRKGDELLFEPNTRALRELGLSCQEALLKVGVSGQVLVPLQNFRRDDIKLDGGTELGCVEPFGCDVELPSPGVGLCDCVEESNGAVELSDSGVGPDSGIEARLVDKPDADSILVAASRVRPCYPELSNLSWTGPKKRRRRRRNHSKEADKESNECQPDRTVGTVTRSVTRSTD